MSTYVAIADLRFTLLCSACSLFITAAAAAPRASNQNTKYIKEIMTNNDQLQCMIAREQFPEKLYAILELARSESRGCSSDVVTWLPHGRAFRVLDVDRFMTDIVPTFFNQTRIRSFYRQLNLWGFKR